MLIVPPPSGNIHCLRLERKLYKEEYQYEHSKHQYRNMKTGRLRRNIRRARQRTDGHFKLITYSHSPKFIPERGQRIPLWLLEASVGACKVASNPAALYDDYGIACFNIQSIVCCIYGLRKHHGIVNQHFSLVQLGDCVRKDSMALVKFYYVWLKVSGWGTRRRCPLRGNE